MKPILTDYFNKQIDTMNILNIADAQSIIKDSKQECIIVTGVTGQDGSYMADFLLENTDYLIFGGVRRLSVQNHDNIKHLKENDRFYLLNFDLTDAHTISRAVEILKPSYFINLAAQSFVGASWDFPAQTWDTNTTSILHILEAIRAHHPSCRLYQAGSSEEFGDVLYSPQDEKHPLRPRSPYGASKAASRQLIKAWRDSYDLYAVQGWLFNHESPRRGEEFVTRKISKEVARISRSRKYREDFGPLVLGNLDAIRDWSHAQDFVEGIWLMLNQDTPKDYVLASGETHTVREFVEKAFKYCDFTKITWVKGETPEDEEGIDEKTGEVLVIVSPRFYRPAEVCLLNGDPELAKKELNWKKNIDFDELVRMMIHNDSEEEKAGNY
jgi:GDPmannose 4,6-dehydratase